MASLPNRSEWIEGIVENYSDMLIRVAFSYMKNISDAEDMVHDAFLKLIEKSPSFKSQEHEKAWLIRVTINNCKNRLKTSWFKKTVSLDRVNLSFTSEESGLVNTVLELPEKYRIVIHLYYYQGYCIKEIAGILDLKETTVASQLQRGRKLLKSKLKGDFDYE